MYPGHRGDSVAIEVTSSGLESGILAGDAWSNHSLCSQISPPLSPVILKTLCTQ